ncbi:MAG TPA: complex I NDUFA9 subunit family protein [Acidiferrobacterales bacterium]|nr:complex I NDUFA9 subunit family protein [Acidiferrobacterales bacterium]
MSIMRIAVLGGTGFVGRRLCEYLAAAGHEVRVLTRHRERHRDLLVLPTAQVIEADVHNPAVLRREFQGLDAVVNLVGILNEAGRDGKGFESAHVELPAKVVQACRQSGVGRLLHMSALHASPDGPSHYLRSKGRGEQIVHAAGSDALQVTSFRPSVIFGPRDSFTNRFAGLLRQVPFVFPLACAGARMQPVHVDDVAQAFVLALDRHATFGKRYNLCGPQVYSLREIVTYIARQLGLKRYILPLNDTLSYMQATVLQFAPGKPFTPDNYRSLQVASVCEASFPAIFGITPGRFDEIVPTYIQRVNS